MPSCMTTDKLKLPSKNSIWHFYYDLGSAKAAIDANWHPAPMIVKA